MSFIRKLHPRASRDAFIMITLVSFLLAACSHVPIATMVKLRNFDLLKTDPGGLRIAVRYPDDIRIPEGGARMHLAVKAKSDGSMLLEERVEFEEIASRADKAELSAELKAGTRISIFRIPERNTPFFKGFQKYMRDKSEAERDALEGTMSISVSACLTSGTVPDKVLVSTFLKSSELGSFVPLLRDVDLAEVISDGTGPEQPDLQPCKPERTRTEVN